MYKILFFMMLVAVQFSSFLMMGAMIFCWTTKIPEIMVDDNIVESLKNVMNDNIGIWNMEYQEEMNTIYPVEKVDELKINEEEFKKMFIEYLKNLEKVRMHLENELKQNEEHLLLREQMEAEMEISEISDEGNSSNEFENNEIVHEELHSQHRLDEIDWQEEINTIYPEQKFSIEKAELQQLDSSSEDVFITEQVKPLNEQEKEVLKLMEEINKQIIENNELKNILGEYDTIISQNELERAYIFIFDYLERVNPGVKFKISDENWYGLMKYNTINKMVEIFNSGFNIEITPKDIKDILDIYKEIYK